MRMPCKLIHCNNLLYLGNYRKWVCDDDPDCSDHSDEQGCSENCKEGMSTACDSGGCIPNYWLCDGYPDCQDGSDENATRCTEHECLPNYFRYKCFYFNILLVKA